MQLLGGAMTAKEFSETVVPRLGNGLGRFTAFNLSEKREQDDRCPGGPITLYFKSLLYFVARSLEQFPSGNVRQTPMVGLQSALAEPMSAADPRRLGEIIDATRIVISPTPIGAAEPPPDSRSHAVGHGDLDNDADTLTSVLLRILRTTTVDTTRLYQAFAAAPAGAAPGVGTAKAAAAERFDRAAAGSPASSQEAGRPGPVGAVPPGPAKARPKARSRRPEVPESPVPAPTSVDYADMLEADGWEPADEPPARRRRTKSRA
jgi:hypothetical protein